MHNTNIYANAALKKALGNVSDEEAAEQFSSTLKDYLDDGFQYVSQVFDKHSYYYFKGVRLMRVNNDLCLKACCRNTETVDLIMYKELSKND